MKVLRKKPFIYLFKDRDESGGYRMSPKSPFKEREAPEKKGKFIQLRNNNTEYLVLSPISLSPFHANILERFCRTNGIYGEYTNSKMEKFEIDDLEWEVFGGHWEMDDDKKILVLSGSSYVYGRFAPSRLREKIRAVDELKGYRVVIK